MSSSTRTKCSICENVLDEKDHIVTTDCQHTFHLACAENRLDAQQKSDCRVSFKESAPANAIGIDTNKWECEKCSIDNELSTNRCEGCGALRYASATNSYVVIPGNCFSQYTRLTLFVRLFFNS